jgi:hypothetical protein
MPKATYSGTPTKNAALRSAIHRSFRSRAIWRTIGRYATSTITRTRVRACPRGASITRLLSRRPSPQRHPAMTSQGTEEDLRCARVCDRLLTQTTLDLCVRRGSRIRRVARGPRSESRASSPLAGCHPAEPVEYELDYRHRVRHQHRKDAVVRCGCAARTPRRRFLASRADDHGRTGSAAHGTNRIRDTHGAGAEYA